MEQINKKIKLESQIDTYITEILDEKKEYLFNSFTEYLFKENDLTPTQQQYINIYKIIKNQNNYKKNSTYKLKYQDYSEPRDLSIKIIYKYPDLITCNFKSNEIEEFYLNIIKYYLKYDKYIHRLFGRHRLFDNHCNVRHHEWIYSFLKKHIDNISNELSIKIIQIILKVVGSIENCNHNLFVFSSLLLFKSKIGVIGYIENSFVHPLVSFLSICSRFNNSQDLMESYNPFIDDHHKDQKKKDISLNVDIEMNFNEIIQNANDNVLLDKETIQKTFVYLLSICESSRQVYYYNLIEQETNFNVFYKINSSNPQTISKITKNDYDIIIKPLVEIGEFTSSLFLEEGFRFDCDVLFKLGSNKCIKLFREYCKIQKVKDDKFSDTTFPIECLQDEIFKLDETLLNESEKGRQGERETKLIDCYKSRINEILSISSIDIDEVNEMVFNIENCQIRKTLITEQYLDHFIVLLDNNLISNSCFGIVFKNELSNIISNENRYNDPVRNKLVHALTCCRLNTPQNVQRNVELSNTACSNVSISFIIIKDIILLYLEQENNQSSKNFLNVSMVSKRIFTIVQDYINNTTSPIVNKQMIGELITKGKCSNSSLIDLNNIKSVQIYYEHLSQLNKHNGLMQSLVHIEIDRIGPFGWDTLKDQNYKELVYNLKQLGIEIVFKLIDISSGCKYEKKISCDDELAIRLDDNHHKQFGNSKDIDFSIISNLKVNISSFLKIYKENPLVSNIKHLQINAPLYFNYSLVDDYLNQQEQQICNGNIKVGGLEILEIHLEHKRSIQRILNIFEPLSSNLNTVIFNVLYSEEPLSFSCLVSTIFNLISNNSKFSKVTTIIIMNSSKNPLHVKWDNVNYYSFNCLYPFDFKVFNRINYNQNNQLASTTTLSDTYLYGNDINEKNIDDFDMGYNDESSSDYDGSYYDDGYVGSDLDSD